jgi:protein tyrosine phosphatase (PTP) superfamily phosphohydrolase (DUF442 family)
MNKILLALALVAIIVVVNTRVTTTTGAAFATVTQENVRATAKAVAELAYHLSNYARSGTEEDALRDIQIKAEKVGTATEVRGLQRKVIVFMP